ncbi:MAG: hypothetical protein AB8G99_05075 [Planctomycetaceae bacterium]
MGPHTTLSWKRNTAVCLSLIIFVSASGVAKAGPFPQRKQYNYLGKLTAEPVPTVEPSVLIPMSIEGQNKHRFLQISDDGKLLASVYGDRRNPMTLTVLDTSTGRPTWQKEIDKKVHDIGMSTARNEIFVWTSVKNSKRYKPPVPVAKVYDLASGEEKRTIVLGLDGRGNLWKAHYSKDQSKIAFVDSKGLTVVAADGSGTPARHSYDYYMQMYERKNGGSVPKVQWHGPSDSFVINTATLLRNNEARMLVWPISAEAPALRHSEISKKRKRKQWVISPDGSFVVTNNTNESGFEVAPIGANDATKVHRRQMFSRTPEVLDFLGDQNVVVHVTPYADVPEILISNVDMDGASTGRILKGIQPLQGRLEGVFVAVSADGSKIAAVMKDRSLAVWSVPAL